MGHKAKGRTGLTRLMGNGLAAAVCRAAPPGCRTVPAWVELQDRVPSIILGPGDELFVFSWLRNKYDEPAHREAWEQSTAAGFTASSLTGMMPQPENVLLVAHAQEGVTPRRWTATLVFCAGDAPQIQPDQDADEPGI